MELLQWLQSSWGELTQHPWVYVGAMVVTAGLVWGAAGWFYNHRIESQNATIKLIETERDMLRSQVSAGVVPVQPAKATDEEGSTEADFLKPESFIPYNRDWDKVTGFYLWQAAWLWIAQEPRPRIRSGSAAYPVYSMLKQAAIDGNLKVTPEQQGSEVNTRARVARSDLRFYAAMYAAATPPFLVDDI
jgi:hypothetical protein